MSRICLRLVLSTLSVLALSLPAYAKDICIQDGVIFMRFAGVKSLSKPGSVTPLHGFYTNGSQVSSLTGTAFRRADGSVSIGVYVHTAGVSPASTLTDFMFTMSGDTELNATGSHRYLDSPTSGHASTWTPIPCSMFPVP
jgi:hypothetical protein